MKTKIKLVILSVVCMALSGGISDTHAGWYGAHSYWYGATGFVECNSDGDTTGGAGMPPRDWRVTAWGGAVAGTMTCEFYDAANPTTSANNVTGAWSNTNITITLLASDFGGSGLSSARYAWNAPCAAGTSFSNGNNIVLSTEGVHVLNLCVTDAAGNVGNWTGTYYLDKTPPTILDVINSNSANLLATNAYPYSISVGVAGGSPIVLINATSENYINESTTTARTTASNTLSFSWNIQDVDTYIIVANGARQYSFTITRICDQATNCWVGSQAYNHNVYANPNIAPTTTLVSFGAVRADGNPNNFTQTIRDGYGNNIVPGPGISRTIAMSLSSISNTMFLNQYNRSGGSSVFVTPPNTIESQLLTTGTQVLGNQPSTNGSYPLAIRAYTPTANSYALPTDPISDPLAMFGFVSNLVVTDTLGINRSFSQTLANPNFGPLYSSNITGDLRTGGFIEGTEQQSMITTTNHNGGVFPTGTQLQLEFSGANAPTFDLFGGSVTNSTTPIVSRGVMTANPGAGSTSLYTKLIAKTIVNTFSDLQLSTHYSYTLNGRTIVYNSDVIGKSGGYWGTVIASLGNQVGIKIIGPIASKIVQSIVTGQFVSGTSIFGGISRADARNNIKKSITLATRNMIFTGRTGNITTLTGLPTGGSAYSGSYISKGATGSILSLKQSGGHITLNHSAGIAGKRTLVIKGANLYIVTNMYYDTATPNSILGVVVQKDEAGNGGNLYIHPNVTNIVGTYIVDGSIMSSNDGTTALGTSNIGILKNQLYIHGSIVSENTIGGSRMIPPKCPSLFNGICDLAESQKYDLNYLRRYYLFGNQPFGGALVIGGETCPLGICTNINAVLKQKFTSTSEDLAKYPVIIEYNPNILSNPPIGFESSKD